MGDIMDWMDDLLGRLNMIDEVFSLLTFARRGRVRYTLRRGDKGGNHAVADVQAHLKHYGIDSVNGGFSRDTIEYTISKGQERWHNYLVKEIGDGQVELRTPKRAWKDKRKRN